MTTRPLTEIDIMAIMVKHEIASEELRERLAVETMRSAKIVACLAARDGLIPWPEVEDIVQATAAKAWRYLGNWNSTKASWLTYVSWIAKSVIGDYGRAHGRRHDAENAYCENNNLKGEIENEQ